MRTYLLLALLLAFIVGTTLAVPASDVALVSDNPLADLMKPPCREESKTCGWLIAAKCCPGLECKWSIILQRCLPEVRRHNGL